MSVAELNLAPRGRGRAAKALAVEHVRDLAPADLALLASERGIKPQSLTKIRDRHHALARCLASGSSNTEASAITGYDPSRISILKSDPAFQELLAHYTKIEEGMFGEFVDRASMLSLTALTNLQDMLEDESDPLPAAMQLEIARFAADRSGNAPVTRVQNTNINIDLGSKLKAARERAALQLEGPRSGARPEFTDAEFTPVPPDGS